MPAAVVGLTTAAAVAQAPPGFSPLDKSNPAASRQDSNLKPHPTPPTPAAADKLPVDKIKLPAGFKAEAWSSGHPGARTMVQGDKGTVFMGTRIIGRVYAITEKDGKREAKVLLQGLTQPNGLAFKDGALYVFAINRVLRYDNIEDKLDSPGNPVELTDKFNLPDTVHHNWKYAAFGPDGKLYVQVGANCNICELNPGIHAQIRRYNADGSDMEIVARGVRNTVGFDWHPVTGELWFTDNGRDWAGDAGPEDELNRIAKGQEGANYGFPYCHANGVPDPDIKRPDPCAGVVLPAALLGPHAGALGIKFYTGSMFPAGVQERRPRGAAWFVEPEPEVRLRRLHRGDAAGRHGEADAVPDRSARRGQERVPRPAHLRPAVAGWVAPGLRRAEWGDLSRLLQRTAPGRTELTA